VRELDRRLKALGRAEADRDLSGLEAAVWAKIDGGSRLPALPHRLAASLCVSAAFFALALGAAAGLAHARPQPGVFSVQAPLAPSTILID
jgi:hypothetical protein